MTRHEEVARGIRNAILSELRQPSVEFLAEATVEDVLDRHIATALREAEAAGAAREREACAALADAMPKTYLVSGNREKITRPSDVAASIRSRQSPEGK